MKKSIEAQEKTIQLVSNELNAKIETCYKLALRLKEEDKIVNYVNTDFSQLDEETANSIRTNAALSLFSNIISSNNLFRSSCLIKNNNEYVIQNPYDYAIDSSFIEQVLPVVSINRNTRIITLEKDGKSYYCLYTPVYQRNSRVYSHLLILINDRFISNIILKYKRKDDSFIIVDDKERYVYYSDYRIPDKPGFDVSITVPSRIDIYRNSDKLVLATHLNKIGWSISLQIPNNIVFEELYRSITTTAIIIIIALVLVFIINYLVVDNFNKRIHGVVSAMERIKAGELNYRYEGKGTDEISQIGYNLNNMVDTLNSLVYNVSKAQLKAKEAQLYAIQRQINPHFLYNTLETIRMVALYNKDPQAARIAKSLADLFRYNLGKEGQIVSIEKELDYTLKYIDIQKVRYKEKFTLEIDIDPLVLNYSIPHMVLQPIIENAMFHGVEPSTNPTTVLRLIGRMEGQTIYIQIQDEGVGMNSETLQDIRKSLNSEYSIEEPSKHLGIVNVNERMKLFFNIDEPINIDSICGKGTTVTLRFPAIRYAEE
ncbi:MAG TPA: sensor histidine kinase [Clostridiaceae bacterium]|nr:sensor histidine kinase [Clostridiaceae bacterium]